MPSFTTYNFAWRQQLFHKQGSVALSVTNPFSECISQKTELTGDNYNSTAVRDLPYRSIGLNFTFKFGRLKLKRGRKPEDMNITNPPSGN